MEYLVTQWEQKYLFQVIYLEQIFCFRGINKFKETGDSIYISQNKLDKDCFQHYIAYGNFKDFSRRTTSDKTLCDKAFNFAKNLTKYDGYQ